MSLLVSDILKMAEKQLADSGIVDAKVEAEQIYCHLKNINRTQFFQRWSRPATDIEMENYFALIKERSSRRPMQHIIGKTEFMGYPFNVREGVLIPRMDTETVVLAALDAVKNKDSVLDLCSGSGIIGVSLAKAASERKEELKVTAVDISDEAIALTEENSKLNKVKVEVCKSDLFTAIKKKKYNVIVSNPPYIRSDVIPTLEVEVKNHDPLLALDGGQDGLDFYRRIIQEAPSHLKKEGCLVLEIGNDQGEAVSKLMEDTEKFKEIKTIKDLSGHDRVVTGQLQIK